MTREYRYITSDFELRGVLGEGGILEGYAAVFGAEATIGGMFREKIGPKAFNKTVKESDVRALFNHDPNMVLGRNKAGTLRLLTDEHGLRYEIDLPSTQMARDLWTSIDRGDISQSSFAFESIQQRWDEPKDELPLRTLQEVRLYDVSPVTYPAYEATQVQARSILDAAFVLEEERTTPEPESEPGPEPEISPLPPHSEPTPEPVRGTPLLVARLALLERLK